MTRVHLLLDRNGDVQSVYADESEAKAQRDKFNADPWLDAETPDAHAPYTVDSWVVTEARDQRRAS